MSFLVSGVILIKAINTMGYPIAKLKDYLQLIITINNESTIIPCKEERSGGIYAFNINSISPFAKVFVCLKQSVLLDTSMISDDKLNLCNATQYLSQMPYFLHPDCKQINFIGTMCNTSKPIPFTFILSPKAINIGIIKAYKKDSITKNFLADSTALSNPKNEIYTMDLNQEINLKAFVYERQKTYLASKDITDTTTQIAYSNSLQKGNITKNITSITPLESANIKWAFKIVNGSYKADSNARDEAFPALGEKKPLNITNKDNKNNNPTNTTKDNINKLDSIPDNKSYVVLEHLQGDSIFLKLSDIFSDTALESLVGKNIIFFAYSNEIKIPAKGDGVQRDAKKRIISIDNAYSQYNVVVKNDEWHNRKISQDKITSIELKILKTRFRLEFDGEYLFFYENEREIAKWQARSGKAIDKISADSSEFKAMKRCFIPFTSDKSFYYDLSLHSSDSTKPLSENEYFIKLPIIDDIEIYSDSTLLTKIAQINSEPFKLDNNDVSNTNINTTLNGITFLKRYFSQKLKADNTPQAIPLKVKYQKRILIIIERFKQTTESTTARMNIYVDRKRFGEKVQTADDKKANDKKTGKAKPSKKSKQSNATKTFDILDEEFNATLIPTNNPYAFILERPSPDTIGGTLRLRIPEGRYKVNWRVKSNFGTTINPHNNFVGKNRVILFHHGNSPRNSDGCLLINENNITKNNGEIVDNILKTGKKDILIEHIQTNFTKAILGKKADSMESFVATHIEIRIKNGF